MKRWLALLPLAAFCGLALYFALSLRPGHDPEVLPSAMIDKPMPDFALPALAGEGTLASADLRGRVTVVNFFASWCVPCRVEHPMLMTLAREKGVAIVGIAYKDAPAAARKLLADAGDPYAATGQDREGRVAIDFGVYGVPETYVIDRAGRIRRRYVGPLTPETVARDLLPLLHTLGSPGAAP